MTTNLVRNQPVAIACALTVAFGVWLPGAPAAGAAELALKRVMLSTGGVGYFEHEAVVEGNSELVLDVRLDQVDDVLKSIVVFDDRGAVGTIRLPGRRPLEQIFRDLSFTGDALESGEALLNALQGAEVRVTGPRQLRGRLLRVTPEVTQLPDGGGTITRHRVSLITDQGLQQLVLEEADSIQFVDPELQGQVDQALAAIVAYRAHDRRTLTIETKGEGRRTVRVGYVVETPLWKTAYRLILPADRDARHGLLQGWAVIENMSGYDWRDVELTVVSGNPVTFRQALYTAYYVARPEVPVEVLGRVLPRPDTGAVRGRAKVAAAAKREQPRSRALGAMRALAQDRQEGFAAAPMAEAEAAAPAAVATMTAAESEEATTQVVFRVADPVSVESGHSLVVAIVNREMPTRRIAHYQPQAHDRHPLAAVRLENDGATGLPPGVLTLYERSGETGATGEAGAVSFIGDARLATLPAGDDRLVSFAVDQKTLISKEIETTKRIASGTISRGVFRLTRLHRQTTVYRIKGPAREARAVLIDHPRRPDWKLVVPDEDDVVLTARHYRIGLDLAPGSEKTVPVTVERPIVQSIGIASLKLPQIVAYATTGGLQPAVRRAFERLAELQRMAERHKLRIGQLEGERKRIYEDQDRIRDNLARVQRDSTLFQRYLKKLGDQENALETIVERLDQAQRRHREAGDALAAYIRDLKV